MRIIAAATAILATLLFSAPANAVCVDAMKVLTYVTSLEEYRSHEILSGRKASKAVKWFNQQPPTSEKRYQVVIIVRLKGAETLLLLGNGGRVCTVMDIGEYGTFQLMRTVYGEAV